MAKKSMPGATVEQVAAAQKKMNPKNDFVKAFGGEPVEYTGVSEYEVPDKYPTRPGAQAGDDALGKGYNPTSMKDVPAHPGHPGDGGDTGYNSQMDKIAKQQKSDVEKNKARNAALDKELE